MLELGAGQGRDTLFFSEQGFDVHVLDYAKSASEAIEQKARQEALSAKVTVAQHDVREPLPYPGRSFDAREILGVLWPGGLCVYTARTTDDPDFGQGIHHGEGLYESGGFIVHFFSAETVELLADGYETVEVDQFEEGGLPRRLYRVKSCRGRRSGCADARERFDDSHTHRKGDSAVGSLQVAGGVRGCRRSGCPRCRTLVGREGRGRREGPPTRRAASRSLL